MPIDDQNPVLLSTDEVALLLGAGTRTLLRWRAQGGGPPWIRVAASGSIGRIRYRRAALLDWLRAREESGCDACNIETRGDPG